MYDLKPGQLIECEWIDPVVCSDWQDVREVHECYRFLCRSVGYVHSAKPDGLVLTASYGEDPGDGRQSLLLQQHLPWGCITDLWILQLEK